MISHAEQVKKPSFIGGATLRGAAYRGKLYERKIGQELKAAEHIVWNGPWFSYQLSTGLLRYCQPDYIIQTTPYPIIIEVKLSLKADSDNKLKNLYHPVVEKALGKKFNTLLVVKILSPEACCAHGLLDAVEELSLLPPPHFLLAHEYIR